MDSEQSLNPYALLGVTIDHTPSQVRKSYYELALIMHPDRGGRAEDMRILQCAYEYVMEQVEGVNRATTYEDLEQAFATFCLEQKQQRPAAPLEAFRDIHDAANEEFHRAWDEMVTSNISSGVLWRASCAGGYEHEMVRSSPTLEYSGIEEGVPIAEFPTQMQVYVEPKTMMARPEGAPREPASLDVPLEDYTAIGDTRGHLHMNDYRDAFIIKESPDVAFARPSTLEELLKEREQTDIKQKRDLLMMM